MIECPECGMKCHLLGRARSKPSKIVDAIVKYDPVTKDYVIDRILSTNCYFCPNCGEKWNLSECANLEAELIREDKKYQDSIRK